MFCIVLFLCSIRGFDLILIMILILILFCIFFFVFFFWFCFCIFVVLGFLFFYFLFFWQLSYGISKRKKIDVIYGTNLKFCTSKV